MEEAEEFLRENRLANGNTNVQQAQQSPHALAPSQQQVLEAHGAHTHANQNQHAHVSPSKRPFDTGSPQTSAIQQQRASYHNQESMECGASHSSHSPEKRIKTKGENTRASSGQMYGMHMHTDTRQQDAHGLRETRNVYVEAEHTRHESDATNRRDGDGRQCSEHPADLDADYIALHELGIGARSEGLLDHDQQRVLNACLEGHNVFYSGMGGTGEWDV